MRTIPEVKVGQRVIYQDEAGADHDALVLGQRSLDSHLMLAFVGATGMLDTVNDIPHYSGRLVTTDEEKIEKRKTKRGDPREVKRVESVTRRQVGAFWRV